MRLVKGAADNTIECIVVLDHFKVEIERNLELYDELPHLFPQVSLSSLVFMEVLEVALPVLLVHQVTLPLCEHGD